MRYELPQWVVEANLKGGARHIYAKRVLRMDEDPIRCLVKCMTGAVNCNIKKLDRLLISAPRLKLAGQLAVSLQWISWLDVLGLAMKSERPANVVTGLERLTQDYYTPANVRRLGR